jgi:hypothetical protein
MTGEPNRVPPAWAAVGRGSHQLGGSEAMLWSNINLERGRWLFGGRLGRGSIREAG